MQNASTAAKNMAASANGAAVNLGQIPQVSKAGQTALRGLASIGNMFAGMAIDFIASEAISSIDHLVNSVEYTKEAANGFASSIASFQEEASEDSLKISELNSTYLQLAEGVDNAGHNISLSASDYEKYKDTVSQLSELMPNLTATFNEQGEKIGFVGGKLKDASQQYKDYVKNTTSGYFQNGDEEGNTFQDTLDTYDHATKDSYNLWTGIGHGILQGLGSVITLGIGDARTFGLNTANELTEKGQLDILKQFQSETNDFTKEGFLGIKGKFNPPEIAYFEDITDVDIDDLIDSDGEELEKYRDIINKKISSLSATQEFYWENVRKCLISELSTDDTYLNIENTVLKGNISSFVSSLSSDLFDLIDIDPTDEIEVRTFIDKIADTFVNNDDFANAYSQLLNPSIKDLPVDEARNKIQQYAATIAKGLNLDPNNGGISVVQSMLGYDDWYQNTAKQFDNAVAYASNGSYKSATGVANFKGFDQQAVIAAMNNNSINTEEEIENWLKILEKSDSLDNAIKSYTIKKSKQKKSFSEVWSSFDADDSTAQAKESLLELAEAGKLTASAFEESSISQSIMNETGLSAEQAAQKINDFVEDIKQLNAIIASYDSATATEEETSALGEKLSELQNATKAEKEYYINKLLANSTDLTTSGSIQNLILLISKIDDASTAIRILKSLMGDIEIYENATDEDWNRQDAMNHAVDGSSVSGSFGGTSEAKYSQQAKIAAKTSSFNNMVTKKTSTKSDAKNTGSKDNGNKGKKTSSKKNEAKQEIDWISRKLTVLQAAIDKTKAKFENLFSIKAKKTNINTQIKQTKTALNANEKAAAKYQKKANSIHLSDNLKRKVKNGSLNGSLPKLIHSYDEATAKKITKYQNYIDKVQEAKKKTDELRKSLHELSNQKLELTLNNNESKRSYSEAKYANATTVSKKNKILEDEIQTYSSDNKAYNTYYQEKKKLRKSSGKSAAAAVNKGNLKSADKKKIKKLIKSGKEIPAALLKKAKKSNSNLYQKLIDYNNTVDSVSAALGDKKLAAEQNKTAKREKQQQQYQNHVDRYDAKTTLAEIRSSNAVGYQKQNFYLEEQLANLKQSYRYQMKIANLTKDDTEQKRLQAEYETTIAEIKKQEIDNIAADYENQISNLDNKEQDIKNKVSLMETRGQTVTAEYYKSQNNYEAQRHTKAIEERNAIQNALNAAIRDRSIKLYSTEWYEIQTQLQTLDNTINDCEIAIAENTTAIRNIHSAMLNSMVENANRMNTEADFIATLLSRNEMTDSDTGKLTNAGLGTLGTYGIKLETAQSQMREYNKERAILEEMMKHGTLKLSDGSHDYDSLEQLEESYKNIIDLQQEWTKAQFDAEQNIIDSTKESYQAQLDYMSKIIDAKKEMLNLEKDLYDYEKNINEKTKNIAILEKQLVALQGDTSEEGRAKISQIQLSFDEANQDLQDTEYERYISDQQNMLDNMYSEYEDLMQNLFKDPNALLQKGINVINANGELIRNILGNMVENYGYDYSSNFDEIVGAFSTNDEIVTGIQTSINGDESSISKILSEQNRIIQQIYNKDSKTDEEKSFDTNATPASGTNSASGTDNSSIRFQEENRAAEYSAPATTGVFSSLGAEHDYAKQARSAVISNKWNAMKNSLKDAEYASKAKAGKTYSSALNKVLAEKTGYVIKDKNTQIHGISAIKLFGMSLGLKSAKSWDYSEKGDVYQALKKKIGFSQGGIGHLIKASGEDGFALVRNGEGFIAPEHVDSIKELLNIVPDITQFTSALTNIKPVSKAIGNTFGDIVINAELPNVHNVQDFVSAIQTDKKVQRAFTIATKDLMTNGRITNNIQSIK